ncbi:MAG: N-acetylmuramoyl-L-alanine amidase [Balneolales bacterium]
MHDLLHSYYHILAVLLFATLSFALTTIDVSGRTGELRSDEELEGLNDDIFSLNVIVPGRDTLFITRNRHRIAANTTPGARAFLNDKEVHVYPNGAFAGLVEVPTGESTSEIRVVSEEGAVLRKTLYFRRPQQEKTSPAHPLVIEPDGMEPDRYLELNEGDVLDVQFKGSPGHQAFFSIDNIVTNAPMEELPVSQTDGIGGIYSGQYTVQPGDHAENIPVVFTLENNRQNRETAESGTLISITPGAFPKVAEIKGRMAYLNAGTDTDRLGASRLGYIDNGVNIEVTGRRDGQFRVQLSDQLEGYLPVRFAHILPDHTPLPRSSTGSISVYGNDEYDVISLTLSKRLPYTTTRQTNANIIEVDIYGAHDNTNRITHEKSAKGIRSVDWEQVETNHFRLYIHLEHDMHWGYQTGYGIGTSLRIRVQRPPRLTSSDRFFEGINIAIDAGHGGSNLGALGATGVEEKNIVLDISKKVRDRLESEGARVIMTRHEDEYVSMVERTEMVLASNAHVLVSIHANSVGYNTNPLSIQGTSVYFHHIGFRPLAGMIHHSMLELPLRDFGLIGSFNFTLNTLTKLPNVLVETAFLSHPEDEIMLTDPEFQEKLADQIVQGLRNFFRNHAETDYNSPS